MPDAALTAVLGVLACLVVLYVARGVVWWWC